METLTPKGEQELAEMVRDAAQSTRRLRIRGGGTRQDLGYPVTVDTLLETHALSGVRVYEPGALHLVAGAGTPVSDIEKLLQENNQMLAFEPIDHRALLTSAGKPTIGGVVATRTSGSRRMLVGACRDHLLGVRFVNGLGEIIKSGGRVMKNVTGLDLSKVQCGAMGSLGVLSEVSMKTLPLPEQQRTICIAEVSPEDAADIFTSSLSSPFEVSGASYLVGSVYLRLEGLAVQVEHRVQRLMHILHKYAVSILEDDASKIFWRDMGKVKHFANTTGAVWQITLRPSQAAPLSTLMQRELAADISWDWGGGLLWVRTEDTVNASKVLQGLIRQYRTQAWLVRGSEELRRAGMNFPKQPAVLERIAQELRYKFDPSQILNPGIMRGRDADTIS